MKQKTKTLALYAVGRAGDDQSALCAAHGLYAPVCDA